MTYMHEEFTFSYEPNTSPVDNQEIDHAATGSTDVHLTTYTNHRCQTTFPCKTTAVHVDPTTSRSTASQFP